MIGVIGINHNTASMDVRGLFSIDKGEIAELGEQILQKTEVKEIVILSTCNRTEIYFYQKEPHLKKTEKNILELLHAYKNLRKSYKDSFYTLSDYDAVSHLFSVTSGVNSMVIGEDQIVSQVKEAYVLCTNLAFTDAMLMRLFQKSFEAGKKVRSETNIQMGASSVSFLAVDSCIKLIGNNFSNKKVFIIGTGKTSRLVLEKMKKCCVSEFLFTNRTIETAKKFAEIHNGKAVEFSSFKDHLKNYDIIITATGAGRILIDKEDIEDSSDQIFIDLAVPRNINQNVTDHSNVNLITIDSLQQELNNTTARRIDSKKDAEVIIDTMTEDFFNWLENRALRPVIKSITENMQNMHKTEIAKYQPCYSPEEYKSIDEYASRLTNKYIRTLIRKLKEINENGHAADALSAINQLFEFETNINKFENN
jgi:glutamyl-tRNA reductase